MNYQSKMLDQLFKNFREGYYEIEKDPNIFFNTDNVFFLNAFVKELRLYDFCDEEIEKILSNISDFFVDDGVVTREDLLMAAGELAAMANSIRELSYSYKGDIDPILMNALVYNSGTFQLYDSPEIGGAGE